MAPSLKNNTEIAHTDAFIERRRRRSRRTRQHIFS